MQFEKQIERSYWVQTMLNSIPDLLVSVIAAQITESGWLGFVITFFGLQALYLLLWIKDSLWLWARYAVRDRKKMARAFEDWLRAAKFPEPRSSYRSAEDYFEDVMLNRDNMVEVRIDAAATLGQLRFFETLFMVQAGLRTSMAMEDAIAEYKRSFPIS